MDVTSDLAPTGTLRASINLGNPVLAQGTADAPTGVTVDIALALGSRLGVPVALHCFEATVAFTAPYAVIEGVFAVPDDSPITSAADVDRAGIRVGVKKGSAYDLFLTRTLAHAEVVRGGEGTAVFVEQQLEVAAGIRQPVGDFVAANPRTRLLEPRFMEIQQAVGTARSRSDQTVGFLRTFVEELKADGFIASALDRSGRCDAIVAPPAT